MKRLVAGATRSGASSPSTWAFSPTTRSPVAVKPTTDGVSREPERDGMMRGVPPSTVATALYVVPRSMPMQGSMEACHHTRPAPASTWTRQTGMLGPRPMQNVSVSRRYARALLDAAGAQSDQVLAQLEALVVLLAENPEIHIAVGSPALPRPQRTQAVEAIGQAAHLDVTLVNMMKLLTDRNRMDTLPMLARIYRDLVDARLNRLRGTVTSAVALAPAQVEAIRASLEKLTHRSVLLEPKVDRQVLGGVVAQVGSHTWDGSLRTQLRDLEQQLTRPVR